MKIKIVKNKYINALFLLMLFSAVIHMLVVFYLAVKYWNLHFLNYFNIVSLSYVIPNFSNNAWCDVASGVLMAMLYVLILKINKTE